MTLFPEYLHGLEDCLTQTLFLEGNNPTRTDITYAQDFRNVDRAELARNFPHINDWLIRM